MLNPVEAPIVDTNPQQIEKPVVIQETKPIEKKPVQQEEIVELPAYKSVSNWEEGLSGGMEAPVVDLPPVEDVIADF